MDIVYKDIYGKIITIGDRIAYATRSGNSGHLNTGKVLDITEDGVKVLGDTNTRPGVMSKYFTETRIIIINEVNK